VIKEVAQVVDAQYKNARIFERVDVVNILLACDEASRRVDPFIFGAEILAYFLIVFDKIGAQQTLLNEIAFGTNIFRMMQQFSFLKSFNREPFGKLLPKRIT
jgi:hypothetical protein